MPEAQLRLLLEKLLHNQCNDEEKEELFALLEKNGSREELQILLEQLWDGYQQPSHTLSEPASEKIINTILQHNRVVKMDSSSRQLTWKWMSIAASLVLLVGLSIYFLYISREKEPVTTVKTSVNVNAPDRNRAVITLDNGQKIYLDSSANGILVNGDGVKIEKMKDGKLVYLPDSSSRENLVFNTLSNPRVSQVINLTLSDGTKVWLNAESSIRYPVRFKNNDRIVEVTGEVYFEVASSYSANDGKKIPFKVKTGNMEVEVLGTHFNVNAYTEEEAIKVTLLEGKVKLNSQQQTVLLAPGQQGRYAASIPGLFKIQNGIDVDKVMAWKNGRFEFDNEELPVVMRQIGRWYNVDVVYETKPGKEKYGGGIAMQVPLQTVLKMLETNGVHTELKGNKVIVKP